MKYSAFLFSLLLISCSTTSLSVFTEYISVESLPSYQIGTPDPRLYCPDVGEKLHISWEALNSTHLELKIYLRFGNGEDKQFSFPLFEKSGTFVFPLLNDDYWEKRGIFTYKIELYGNDCLIATWTHQLWKERITLHDQEREDEGEQGK